jgi:hypothetical protein
LERLRFSESRTLRKSEQVLGAFFFAGETPSLGNVEKNMEPQNENISTSSFENCDFNYLTP